MTNKLEKLPARSKIISAVLAGAALVSVLNARAESGEKRDIAASAAELRKVDMFAMGNIGFVAHKSNGQKYLEQILKSKNSEPTLMAIIDASDSSVASKIYSLCGLKKISSVKYKSAKEKIFGIEGTVSTMTADVMRKEDVTELVTKIDKFGC